VRVLSSREKQTLQRSRFSSVDLGHCDFAGADLRHARFDHVYLRGADFTGADLRCAVFQNCDLREVELAGARIEHARFDDSSLIGARGLTAQQRRYVLWRGGRFRSRGSLVRELRRIVPS